MPGMRISNGSGPARRVVVAPDKFKGSLTAGEAATAIAAGLRGAVAKVDVVLQPVADGGDGTLEALVRSGFRRTPCRARGPTGQPVDAVFGRRGGTALVELAEASGMRRLPGGRLDPMGATSHGAGELIRAALDAGCTDIVLGVGGSACTDGGMGMLQALGVRVLDAHGADVGRGGTALAHVATVDLTGLDARLASVSLVLASDVDNPLLGPDGAAAGYGPQKGATAAQVATLETGMRRWVTAVAEASGHVRPGAAAGAAETAAAAGAGAAGGVGFAACAVLGARRRPGIDLVLELLDFDTLVSGARLVITGEGTLDRQSLRGKAPMGVAAAAARHGVPTVAVVGRCAVSDAETRQAGIAAVYALSTIDRDVDRSMRAASALVEKLVCWRLVPDWLSCSAR